LTSSILKLEGKGKLIRHISITDIESFPKKEIEKLIWKAVGISEELNTNLTDKNVPSRSIVMSISEKK
jgi:hypothetical protein